MLLATLAACAILGVVGYLLYPYVIDWCLWQLRTEAEERRLPAPPRESTLIGWALIAILASAAAARAILPPRCIRFFTDAAKTQKAFELHQAGRWQFWTERYEMTDADGTPLATFARNRVLAILLLDRWTVTPAVGAAVTCTARERPAWLAPFRRLFGPAGGWLQTDVILTTTDPGRSGDPLGHLARRHPELGRPCLDLSRDPASLLDRRIAIAMGVLATA